MNFFQKFLLLFTNKKDDLPLNLENHPLGIKLGSLVGMNKDFRLLTSGSSAIRGLDSENSVLAKGVLDLGEGVVLHRFYFDDEDLMLQIRTSGYGDNFVEEVILFNYLSLLNISSQHELDRLAGKDSLIGLPKYTHENRSYDRVWGTEPGLAELVLMHETVTNKKESYGVQHLSMLYARETDLSARGEFLLFSVEESGGEDGEERVVQLSTSLGLTLFANDVNVI